MPILTIQLVGDAGPAPDVLAQRIADAAGPIFDAGPGRVWVRLTTLPAEQYAENATPPAGTPRPVFVSVLLRTHPPAEQWQAVVTALTAAVAQCCHRPAEHVHLLLEPEARGRVAFGGRVV